MQLRAEPRLIINCTEKFIRTEGEAIPKAHKAASLQSKTWGRKSLHLTTRTERTDRQTNTELLAEARLLWCAFWFLVWRRPRPDCPLYSQNLALQWVPGCSQARRKLICIPHQPPASKQSPGCECVQHWEQERGIEPRVHWLLLLPLHLNRNVAGNLSSGEMSRGPHEAVLSIVESCDHCGIL